MPIISTNDAKAHKALKVKAAQADTSIGKAVDQYIRFGNEIDLLEWTPEEIEEFLRKTKTEGRKGLFAKLLGK